MLEHLDWFIGKVVLLAEMVVEGLAFIAFYIMLTVWSDDVRKAG